MNDETFKAIQKRAYEIYLYRRDNYLGGSDLDDWFRAEVEIRTNPKLYLDKRIDDIGF